jgi:hypothetical protein
MTPSTETESLAERHARLSREGAERRGVDAALRSLDILISAAVLVVAQTRMGREESGAETLALDAEYILSRGRH